MYDVTLKVKLATRIYLRLNISTTVQTAAMEQIPCSIKRILVTLKVFYFAQCILCRGRALFRGENDFSLCLKESFPPLKTRMLTRLQWCKIRRLMGKPRRYVFLMMSRKDFLKSHILSWRQKVYSNWEDVTSSQSEYTFCCQLKTWLFKKFFPDIII